MANIKNNNFLKNKLRFINFLLIVILVLGIVFIIFALSDHGHKQKANEDKTATGQLTDNMGFNEVPVNSDSSFGTVMDIGQQFNMSDSLLAYYLKSNEFSFSPVILTMADTLFKMAEDIGDTRMQCAALTTKYQYYCTNGQLDSILHYKDIVQDFALKTNQLTYYYFVWFRLIGYHAKNDSYSIAMSEISAMQKSAIERNSAIGLYYSYKVKADIFKDLKLYSIALDSYYEAIKIQKNIPNFSETYKLYSEASFVAMKIKDYESAVALLDSAMNSAYFPRQKVEVEGDYVVLYCNMNDRAKAEEYYSYLVAHNINGIISYDTAHSIDYQIQLINDNFKEADSITKYQWEKGEISRSEYLERKISICGNSGDLKGSEFYLREQDKLRDSLFLDIIMNDFSVNATKLKLDKYRSEKIIAEDKVEAFWDKTILFGFIIASIFVILFVLAVIKLRQINKKLKKSEDSLIISLAEQEKLNIFVSNFLHNVSHEIRTPLNAIVGFSDAIASSVDENSPNSEYSKKISHCSDELLNIINDAVEVSNLSFHLDEKEVEFDVVALCRSIIDSLQKKPWVELELQFCFSDPKMYIIACKGYVSTVIENLLQNAVKFTATGYIKLSLGKEEDNVVIDVIDTGKGIPEEKYEYIFEKYTKLDPYDQGLGLGLPLSRALARKMHGDIIVSKSYTNGACFTFSFKDMNREKKNSSNNE